jgi:RNA polymerase sigma-70 factor (ECF subfamily)
MDEASDAELWRRAVDGDSEGFGVLFDRHGERVRAYCARRTGSLDAADDLVFVVFLEAWRRRAEVELLRDSVLPWLYGIANHTLQRRWRTAVRHRRALDRLSATLTDVPDHAEDVVKRVDDVRDLDRLHQVVRRLRRSDQEVLILCLWQGLEYEAAALALGVPVGTVRSRLSRARARLRAALDDSSATVWPASLSPVEL